MFSSASGGARLLWLSHGPAVNRHLGLVFLRARTPCETTASQLNGARCTGSCEQKHTYDRNLICCFFSLHKSVQKSIWWPIHTHINIHAGSNTTLSLWLDVTFEIRILVLVRFFLLENMSHFHRLLFDIIGFRCSYYFCYYRQLIFTSK